MTNDISIHAPLARCDAKQAQGHFTFPHFNPRTSCEVRRSPSRSRPQSPLYFNPRTSCEVRHLLHTAFIIILLFQSTHLLRGATATDDLITPEKIFQSTHLLRGATAGGQEKAAGGDISIHAPLARCDAVSRT